ncbi:unnamed protein product [Oppiella nova]|uniref:Uncharacterized protein n=1 Tax=Oppiella nova TaxID=334625 RepID=A0A7R9MGU7_9ACAR|nr:unnamed protein product [Oppiella nova]CAG2177106.1 unnamed protein product [Oppiella nova]
MSVKYNFCGKVALVTGSNSGIGAATVLLFAKSGANVVVTGSNATKVSQAAKQCRNESPNGLKALEVVADVTKEEDLQKLVDKTIETFGKIDILVNNAGIDSIVNICDSDYMDKYRAIRQTNLDSVVYLTHICVQHLEKTKGNIINISSVLSVNTHISNSHYCMSRAALNMFTRCMSAELGPKHIRVNSVNPGYIRTDCLLTMGSTKEQSDQVFDFVATKYPVGRSGMPDDVANAILFVASNDSSFITGADMFVDISLQI